MVDNHEFGLHSINFMVIMMGGYVLPWLKSRMLVNLLGGLDEAIISFHSDLFF